MNNKFWLNKRVLITGGTKGLGQAIATDLVRRGAKVATVARGQEPVNSGPLSRIQGDIAEKTQTHRIFAEALAKLGGVDVLINNASALGPTPLRLLLDTECEDFFQVLETNLLGPFRLTKLAVPGMILQGFGIVVNISSDAALNAYPHWGAYSVSKAGLDHMTRIFQAELAATGVRFLALDPGDMDTALHALAVPDADTSQLHRPGDSASLLLDQLASEEFTPVRRSLR